jgi:hypothetical protein
LFALIDFVCADQLEDSTGIEDGAAFIPGSRATRASGDGEKSCLVIATGFPNPFGDVEGNGKRRTPKLVSELGVASGKSLQGSGAQSQEID